MVENGCARSQTFTLTATDACGNHSECVVTYNWKVDTTAPVMTGCPTTPIDLGCNPASLPECATALAVGVTATDDCDGTITPTCSLGAVVENGCARSQTFTLTATDLCGNHSECAVTYTWKVDTAAPVITNCAPVQTVNAGSGGTATLSNLTALLVAGDACSSVVNIVQDPATGTELPVGTNTVVFYVDDGNGNTNTCDTTVTVNAAVLVPPVILSEQVFEGNFQLSFSGPNGQPYRVLASSDLAVLVSNWAVLTSGAFGSEPATYTDTSTASHPARFFRVVSP